MEILWSLMVLVVGWLLVGLLVGIKQVVIDGGLNDFDFEHLAKLHPDIDVREKFTKANQVRYWTAGGFFSLLLDLYQTYIRLRIWLYRQSSGS